MLLMTDKVFDITKHIGEVLSSDDTIRCIGLYLLYESYVLKCIGVNITVQSSISLR